MFTQILFQPYSGSLMKCRLVLGNSEMGLQKTGAVAYLVFQGVIMILLISYIP